MSKVFNGRIGSRRFEERRKRKLMVCESCGKEYRQRYRLGNGMETGLLCCPYCRQPTGDQGGRE